MTRQKLNLLFVEDTASDAELIEKELQKAKIEYAARRVDSEEGFLQAISESAPDLILSEYTLRNFSAVDALRLLQECNRDIPLILVTGTHSEEVAVECMKEGADDYILKDNLRRLPSALVNILKKKDAERQKADTETAFHRSEAQYRLIAENSRDLIVLADLGHHFVYASPSHELVLGRPARELIGMNRDALIHPEDLPHLKELLEQARLSPVAQNTEVRLRHQDGRWLSFESVVSFIAGEAGGPPRILIVSRDVSDRKRAETEIQKLAAFPRFNPNPVLEFAADGTLTYFNDAAQEMAQSLKKAHPKDILPLNTATIAKMCLSTGQLRQHVDNTVGERTLSWSFFPVTANQVVHCYAEDVTDSLNMEAQLRQSQKMDSVGQLAAGVAHDFNNILTIIQGHSGLLTSDLTLNPDALDSVRQISLAAERAASLTRQLLMFSRKQIMQPHLLNLNEVIGNIVKMLQSLVGENVNLRVIKAPNLPAIHADAGMLEQVIVNLAVNARDAMANNGSLVISTFATEIDEGYVQRHPESRTGYFVCLSVTDTGCGMDAATMSHIFEPFFTTKEVGRGTGLGLATVYGILKQHQGWIEVTSEPGKGTTFKVLLPATSKPAQAAEAGGPPPLRGGDETILVVEDEPALRELVQEILQRYGYRVLDAPTGAQALKVWQHHRDNIDLLLTDMMMPEGVSGRELADAVTRERSRLKVIYTSGYSADVLGKEFLNEPGVNFLQKPYMPDTLVQMVRDCLDK